MNYLVWAAFAAAFLMAVFAVYNAVASQGCKVSYDQVRQLLQDAGKRENGCVQSKDSIMLCSGTVFTRDFVRAQMGVDGRVCFCVGRGVEVKNGYVEVRSTLRANVRACRFGNTAYLCINNPLACETGVGGASCNCG